MSDSNIWDAVSAISTTAGAIATFWAVVVSLKLARRSSEPQLNLSASVGLYIENGELHDGVIVTVSNSGNRAEIIANIWFSPGNSGRRLIFSFSKNQPWARTPVAIEPGNSQSFFYPRDNFLLELRANRDRYTTSFIGFILTRKMTVGCKTKSDFTVQDRVAPSLQSVFEQLLPENFESHWFDRDHPVALAVSRRETAIYINLNNRRQRNRHRLR